MLYRSSPQDRSILSTYDQTTHAGYTYARILTSSLLVGITCGLIVFLLFIPANPTEEALDEDGRKVQDELKVRNLDAYLKMVYNSTDSPSSVKLLESAYECNQLNFFWDNAPPEVRKKYPIGYNTSLRWPPPKGTRTRVAAFPYPKGLKKGRFFANFAKTVKLLLNNTSDSATFPGWLVSVYDPEDPNNNSYRNTLTNKFTWASDGSLGHPMRTNTRLLTQKDVGSTIVVVNCDKDDDAGNGENAYKNIRLKVERKGSSSDSYILCGEGTGVDLLFTDSVLECLDAWSKDKRCVKNGSHDFHLMKGKRYTVKTVTDGDVDSSKTVRCALGNWLPCCLPSLCRVELESDGDITSMCNPLMLYVPYKKMLEFDLCDKGSAIEVTHACYPPPIDGGEYPLCDDGGYWLYMTPGTGVFWWSGPRVLVANNKIDAALKLLMTPKVRDYVVRNEGYKYASFVGASSSTYARNQAKAWALGYLADRFSGAEGQTNVVIAISDVINKYKKNQDAASGHTSSGGDGNLLLAAFRRMDACNSLVAWSVWIIYLVAFGFLCLGLLLSVAVALLRSGKDGFKRTVGWTTVLLATGVVLGLAFWYLVTDYMIKGFGWMTLRSGLDITGMTLDEFISCSANCSKSTSKESRDMVRNRMICNGFAITQALDFDLEIWTAVAGLDGFILHAQPNKGGIWSVEMCDIRNFRDKLIDEASKGTKDPSALAVALGICGQLSTASSDNPSQQWNAQIATAEVLMKSSADANFETLQSDDLPKNTQFSGGPVETNQKFSSDTVSFLSYKPVGQCNCNESLIKKDYDDDDMHLTKCLNCGFVKTGDTWQQSTSMRFCSPWNTESTPPPVLSTSPPKLCS